MLGVRVARVPAALTVTVAGTSAVLPAARRRKVAEIGRASCRARVKVAVTVVLRGTPVAPGAGACTVTGGGRSAVQRQRECGASGVRVAPGAGACAVTVGATSVVKLQRESAPSGVPIASVTAAVTVAV